MPEINESNHIVQDENAIKPSTIRILLAEDSFVSQRIAVRILTAKGWEVEVASNGLEVLQALEKCKFDLILMDIEMPKMTGLEATRIIRKNEKKDIANIPIVALTSHEIEIVKEEFKEAGITCHVIKPISPNNIYSVIESLIL